MVDLVGIEPTTSSMPWKRAPSCATGPLFGDTTDCPLRTALSILADGAEIVNATDFLVAANLKTLTTKDTKDHEGNTGQTLNPCRISFVRRNHLAERKRTISRITRSAWSVWKRN